MCLLLLLRPFDHFLSFVGDIANTGMVFPREYVSNDKGPV